MGIEYRGKGNYRFRMQKDGIDYKEKFYCNKKITEEDIKEKNWPREVELAHNKFEINVLEGKIGTNENMRLQELAQLVADEYLRPKKSKNTVSAFLNAFNKHLIPEFGNPPINKLTKLHVTKFINKKLKTHSPASVRTFVSNLSTAYRQGIEWELTTKNPCEKNNIKLKKKNLAELWTAEQIASLLNAIYEEVEPHKTIFITAGGMGYRQGEILGLTIPDVDFNEELIDISKQRLRYHEENKLKYEESAPKTPNSERKSYMPDFVKEAMSNYIRNFMKVTDIEQHLFVNPKTGKVYTHGALYARFKKLLVKAKINPKEYTFHDLRHLQGVLLASSGADLTSMANRMGDTVQIVASTYLHTLDKAEKASVTNLSNFVKDIRAN